MKKLICLLFLLSIFWSSCCHKSDISSIKNNYSPREVNYFYEIAFHLDDCENQPHPIRKWHKDIVLFIEGDTLLGDNAAVLDAIEQINDLQLPVKIELTKNAMQANMVIAFDSRKKFNLDKAAHGIGEVTVNNNVIKSGKIIIVTGAGESEPGNFRKSTILEEITQGLGLMGDSYAYPLSIFYEMPKQVTQLAEIDKRTLKLLYDSAIPTGLRREEFEEVFADQLYHINTEEKLLKYVEEHSISKYILQEILKYGPTNTIDGIEKIVKFHQPVHVILTGDTTFEHKELVQTAIKEINEASDEISVKLELTDTSFHYGGILFRFSEKPQQENSLAVGMSFSANRKFLFDRMYRANVHISYKDTVALRQRMSLAIANSMYRSLALVHQDSLDFFKYENNTLELKPEYKEILQVFYSPVLAENMTKDELQRIIKQMK